MTKANPARGEVEVTIASETYVLAGTFGNLAAFQGALGVEGLPALLRMVANLDPRALLAGIRTLAISGDVKKLEREPFKDHMLAVQKAIIQAITGVMEAAEGNPPGATTESPNY